MLGRYILLGLLSSLCVHVYAQLHGESKLKRLAVIGSGMGGATAAWLIHNATGCHVTVFEASDIVGGRLKETVIDERVVELGGSIGIEANRYFVETTDRLRLTRRSQPPSSVGIWDGKEFIFRSSDSLLSKFFRCVIPALCWATMTSVVPQHSGEKSHPLIASLPSQPRDCVTQCKHGRPIDPLTIYR